MRQYHRLVRFSSIEISPDAERQELTALLRSAPVSSVQIDEAHIKGGYRVTFDLDGKKIDELVSHLDRAGWRTAL
jgi:hypothetical protein